jgi:hypothetical protein
MSQGPVAWLIRKSDSLPLNLLTGGEKYGKRTEVNGEES